MPKRHLLFSLLAFLAFLSAAVGVSPVPAEAAEGNDEASFVVLINELRSSLGLQPLVVAPELIEPSRQWTQQMANSGELAHAPDLSVGVTSDWTTLGENVGVASQGQVQELFDAFVASPGHYENLVNPGFSHLGVGVVYDSEGRIWTTHRFMALAAPVAATTPTTAAPVTAPATTAPTTAPSQSASTTATPTTSVADETGAGEPPPRVAFTEPQLLAQDIVSRVAREFERSGV